MAERRGLRPRWAGRHRRSGARRGDSGGAQVRRLFYLLYEVQKYIVIRQGRGNDAAGAADYKNQSFQIAEAVQAMAPG